MEREVVLWFCTPVCGRVARYPERGSDKRLQMARNSVELLTFPAEIKFSRLIALHYQATPLRTVDKRTWGHSACQRTFPDKTRPSGTEVDKGAQESIKVAAIRRIIINSSCLKAFVLFLLAWLCDCRPTVQTSALDSTRTVTAVLTADVGLALPCSLKAS
ncbi:hypothetical protein VTI74DRAFT_7282 [Chaetomium olivicolor]